MTYFQPMNFSVNIRSIPMIISLSKQTFLPENMLTSILILNSDIPQCHQSNVSSKVMSHTLFQRYIIIAQNNAVPPQIKNCTPYEPYLRTLVRFLSKLRFFFISPP